MCVAELRSLRPNITESYSSLHRHAQVLHSTKAVIEEATSGLVD
jgi:hypothetical protein